MGGVYYETISSDLLIMSKEQYFTLSVKRLKKEEGFGNPGFNRFYLIYLLEG